MATLKEVRINVRTTEEIKRALEITAGLRGLTVSSLVNSLVMKAIREEKSFAPEAFKNVEILSRSNHHIDVGRKVGKKAANWREALRNLEGIWEARDDLPDFRELRKEWDRGDRRSAEK